MLRLGNNVIAGTATNTKENAHSLFDFKWSDHIINEMSWLRSDTFSWQAGSVYTACYNHLTADLSTATSGTETIAGTTITVYTATDGHKIVLADQESAVSAIYAATGVAWYYIVDTANTRFKLPRMKHNKYASQLSAKGSGMTLGVTDGTTNYGLQIGTTGTNSYLLNTSQLGKSVGTSYVSSDSNVSSSVGITSDASKSGIVTDIPEDTSAYKYLYFYVGAYSVSATEQTAGLNAELFNEKMDRNMKNSNAISNCITEIPQDIKLELNNGTLTLKAGSKVYVPNGAGVFDVVTIASDLGVTRSSNKKEIYVYRTTDNSFSMWEKHYSGSTAPTGQTYMLWYDTSANKVKATSDGGSTWSEGFSLPVGFATSNTTQITSIDQVFNGFGYIGSTVFALPGVKGLIPNGRKADGTLNNTEFTTSSVLTFTQSYTQRCHFFLKADAISQLMDETYKYDEANNFNIYTDINKTVPRCAFATATEASGVISNWNPKTTFHALDYNDKGTIAGFGMPSSKYIDLTLGASGSTYTAPANGWFYMSKSSNSTGQYITMEQNTSGTAWFASNITQPNSGSQCRCSLPVKKGQVMKMTYTTGGATNRFCFVYSEGETNV